MFCHIIRQNPSVLRIVGSSLFYRKEACTCDNGSNRIFEACKKKEQS